jgi:hypothetical protein
LRFLLLRFGDQRLTIIWGHSKASKEGFCCLENEHFLGGYGKVFVYTIFFFFKNVSSSRILQDFWKEQ